MSLHRVLEIEAGAERRTGPLQDHHAGAAVALQALEILVERVDQRRIERVEAVGAIERYPVDPVIMFDQQRFGHTVLLIIRRIAVSIAAPSPLAGEGIAGISLTFGWVRGLFLSIDRDPSPVSN